MKKYRFLLIFLIFIISFSFILEKNLFNKFGLKTPHTQGIAYAQNYCPACGTPHKQGDKFCPKCGYGFSDNPAEATIAPSEPTISGQPTQPPQVTSNLAITGITPFEGPPGTMVKLLATGINAQNPGIYKVEFNGVQAQIFVNPDSINAIVPEGASSGPINVYVNGNLLMNVAAFFTVSTNQNNTSANTPGPTIPSTQYTEGPTPVPPTPEPQKNLTNLPAGSLGQGKIVYGCWEKTKNNDDIYVIKAGSNKSANLTHDKNFNTNPCWSPDGKNIAFTSTREGNREIYIMYSDGGNIKNITRNNFWDDNPAWSPKGNKIAFETWRDGNLDVYLMNTDGTGQVNLTKNGKDDILPAWSPDASKIAFASNRDQNYEIYVMKSDGSAPVNLTKNPGQDSGPDWSPDGSKIAFHSNRDGDDEIYVMSSNGSNQVNTSKNSGSDDRFPCWSPDSSKIAFMSNRSTTGEEIYWEICIMNSNGSNMINLTNNTYWDGFPDWVK